MMASQLPHSLILTHQYSSGTFGLFEAFEPPVSDVNVMPQTPQPTLCQYLQLYSEITRFHASSAN